MDDTEGYRLTEAFPYLLNRVGVRMGELFARRLEPFGVTLAMYRAMAALREKGDRRLGELGEITGIELSTLSRLIGTMVRNGLVSRRRPDADTRTVEINLTPAGATLVETLIPLAAHFEEVALRGFAPHEIAGRKRELARIYANLAALDRELEELGLMPRPEPGRRRGLARSPEAEPR